MAYANSGFAHSAGRGSTERVRSWVRRIAERAYRWSVWYGTKRALNELSDHQLSKLGMSRGDIERVASEAAYGA
ncbi:DUF1127 domain-containing protein [Ruegeria pomeroyi]|nr:DUF1127 domain-containing protein [Ruegeria pomeroyi]MCE8534753.1 DUF1127 domain-containing protein [Ruegeria pomeroyi]